MSEADTFTRADDQPELLKSIFPVFPVNVPMPADTAVPGSYGRNQGGSRPADENK